MRKLRKVELWPPVLHRKGVSLTGLNDLFEVEFCMNDTVLLPNPQLESSRSNRRENKLNREFECKREVFTDQFKRTIYGIVDADWHLGLIHVSSLNHSLNWTKSLIKNAAAPLRIRLAPAL